MEQYQNIKQNEDLFGGEKKSPDNKILEKLEERKKNLNHQFANDEDIKRNRNEMHDALRKEKRDNIHKSKRCLDNELPESGGTTDSAHSQESSKPIVIDLPSVCAKVFKDDAQACLEGVTMLRRLLAIKGPTPIQEVIDTGVLPRLISCLSAKNFPQLQVLLYIYFYIGIV